MHNAINCTRDLAERHSKLIDVRETVCQIVWASDVAIKRWFDLSEQKYRDIIISLGILLLR